MRSKFWAIVIILCSFLWVLNTFGSQRYPQKSSTLNLIMDG